MLRLQMTHRLLTRLKKQVDDILKDERSNVIMSDHTRSVLTSESIQYKLCIDEIEQAQTKLLEVEKNA